MKNTQSRPLHTTHVGCFGFGIPAVTGVVGHLVLHVLAEAEFLWRHTNLGEVEVDAANEVA